MYNSPGRSQSRSEHVFVEGNDIGRGTRGMIETIEKPEDYQARINEVNKKAMSAYWERRKGQSYEQKKREAERLRRIADAQAGTPKQRLMQAKAKRIMEIEKMTAERKAFERQFKEDQEREAAERNRKIHEEKEEAKRQHDEAVAQRDQAKERYLVKVRKERAELAQVRELEAEADRLEAEKHYAKMKELHETWKENAEKEKLERYEQKVCEVKEKQKKQEKRVQRHRRCLDDIRELKHGMISENTKRGEQARNRVKAAREAELYDNAAKMRDGVKQRAEYRKTAKEHEQEERSKEAKEKAKIAEENRKAYVAAKEQKFEELRREAQEQKLIAQEQMEQEKEEQRQAHLEYIRLMKSLVDRKGGRSTSPTGSNAGRSTATPSRERSHPTAMSPTKLASPARK